MPTDDPDRSNRADGREPHPDPWYRCDQLKCGMDDTPERRVEPDPVPDQRSGMSVRHRGSQRLRIGGIRQCDLVPAYVHPKRTQGCGDA